MYNEVRFFGSEINCTKEYNKARKLLVFVNEVVQFKPFQFIFVAAITTNIHLGRK